ncbi:hypothetical protein [Haliea sp. E17]|uniref:hypothetical protein n=1 Tax=Haliea sp. E17 TaxID=3401576 RepID=UPI003AAEF37B
MGASGATQQSFSVREIVRESWRIGSTCKLEACACWLLFIGSAVILTAAFTLLGGAEPGSTQEIFGISTYPGFLDELAQTIVLLPMVGGLWVAGVAFARGNHPRFWSLLYWYGYTLKLLLVSIFSHILIFLGLLLLVLPGIYLAVSFQLAIPIAVDKQCGPFAAIAQSWRIIHRCWFRVLALDCIAVLAVLGSLVLFGIPLIWVMPAILVGRGLLYEQLVGIETETLRKLSYNPGPSGLRSQSG